MTQSNEPLGFLRVFVRTAGGSLPVENAAVRITGNGMEDAVVLYTDRSGLTPVVSLSTPALSASQTAGNVAYADYRIEVTKDGFYRQTTENVPIFPGITALQPITLIGLSEFDADTLFPLGSTVTVPTDPQVLGNGEVNR